MSEPLLRILIINPKLDHALGIKKALDALGGFETRAFTSPINALEFARKAVLDMVVADFHLRSPNLAETTLALRKLNVKVKLILTNAPDEAIKRLHAHGSITLPARAREVEVLMRELFPPLPQENRTNTDTLGAPVALEGSKPAPDSTDLFERLAKEEPPVPTGTEGGTVREAVRALLPRNTDTDQFPIIDITPRQSDTDDGQPVLVDALPEEEETPDLMSMPDVPDDDEASTGEGRPTHESAPAESDDVPLLPVPEDAPLPPVFDDYDADLEDAPASDDEGTTHDNPRVIAPETASVQQETDDAPPPLPPDIKIPGQRRPVKNKTETPVPSPADMPAPTHDDLRRALIMTHEMVGSTAAALILTDENDIVTYTGEMPTEEIGELRAIINGDWSALGRQSRTRYAVLPTSRQEYVLHTRPTQNGYHLTLAFDCDLPISEIRAQSDAVARQLHEMPTDGPALDFDTQDADAALTLPFTAVWMLQDADDPLTADIAQAVVLALDARLHALDWQIHALNVHSDFIYVYCDVQTTYLAGEVVAELKSAASEAVCQRRPDWDADALWADAYMTLVPGRELAIEEVQAFLSFTRARLNRAAE